MGRVIYKKHLQFVYDIPFSIKIQKGADIISCQVQGGEPTIWFECDVEVPIVDRVFQVFGTGQEVFPEGKYLASLQMGYFVWHVYDYEETNNSPD